jgi:hypothetical protein
MVIASSIQRFAHLSHELRGREWLSDERKATIDSRPMHGGSFGHMSSSRPSLDRGQIQTARNVIGVERQGFLKHVPQASFVGSGADTAVTLGHKVRAQRSLRIRSSIAI